MKFNVLIFLFAYSNIANAYLDPGSISLVLQGILAVIAGAIATGKYWFRRFISLFKKKEITIKDTEKKDSKITYQIEKNKST